MLLDRHEAAKRLGRSHYAIQSWELDGHLRVATRTEQGRALYDSRDLLACARKMQQNYHHRRIVAGSGRGHLHPATDEIRRRILAGDGTKAIAEAVGCSISTVSKNRRILAAGNITEQPNKHSEGKDTPEPLRARLRANEIAIRLFPQRKNNDYESKQ